MYISVIKHNYMVKSVLFFSFLFVISLGLIGGCSDGGGKQNSTRALTEINFAEDSALRAELEGVVVTFLESPESEAPENDTGEVGIDLIPLRYAQTTEQTFCWEDDNTDAMHFMELQDSQGSVILTVEVNGDCATEIIEEGDYVMSIHHDGSIADSLPIFLIPDPEDSVQTRKTEGFINRIKLFASNVIKRIDGIVTRDARAQTVEENRSTLLSTNSCVACNLEGARLIGADLRKADLSVARLFEAVLLQANLSGAELVVADLRHAVLFRADLIGANLSGARLIRANLGRADLTDAILSSADLSRADFREADLSGAIMNNVILNITDFSGATWCDGCICASGSFEICNGCAPVEEVCPGP